MGNSQCGILSRNSLYDKQYQFIADEDHEIFGNIYHLINQKTQEQVAVKKLKFYNQTQFKKYQQQISLVQQISLIVPIVKIIKIDDDQKQKDKKALTDENKVLKCDKTQIFITLSSQHICSMQQTYKSLTLHMQYISQKHMLSKVLKQKENTFANYLKDNKIHQNIHLSNKLKFNQYQKIDLLPQKERNYVNIFWTEIQILRNLDAMIASLYAIKNFGFIIDDAVRPQLFCKADDNKIIYIPSFIIKQKGNLHLTCQRIKQLISKSKHTQVLNLNTQIKYIYPPYLADLSKIIQNDLNINQYLNPSKETIQKHNIFSLGLILVQMCLLESNICAKLYSVQSPNKLFKTFNENKKDQINIKFNEIAVKKYLSQIKGKYGDKLVDLLYKMIFNYKKDINGYESYEALIQKLSQLIQQNLLKLKQVYDPSLSLQQKSKQKSLQKSKRISLDNSRKRQISSNSSITTPSISSKTSYSQLPIQSNQPILSYLLLKKNFKQVTGETNKLLLKNQIALTQFSKDQQKFKGLILKDQQRILYQLNKLSQNTHKNTKNQRFSYRKMENSNKSLAQAKKNNLQIHKTNIQTQKTNIETQKANFQTQKANFQSKSTLIKQPKEIIPNQMEKNVQKMVQNVCIQRCKSKSQQRRINSITKIKRQNLQKAHHEQLLGSICHAISPPQTINRNDNKKFLKSQPDQLVTPFMNKQEFKEISINKNKEKIRVNNILTNIIELGHLQNKNSIFLDYIA